MRRTCGLERAGRCLPRPAHHLFLSNFWGLAIPKKSNTETRVYRFKFGNGVFILKPLADIAAGGQFIPEGIINPVSQCFSTDSGSLALVSISVTFEVLIESYFYNFLSGNFFIIFLN